MCKTAIAPMRGYRILSDSQVYFEIILENRFTGRPLTTDSAKALPQKKINPSFRLKGFIFFFCFFGEKQSINRALHIGCAPFDRCKHAVDQLVHHRIQHQSVIGLYLHLALVIGLELGVVLCRIECAEHQ